MKTAAFATLGCKVNQVETEQLIEDFQNHGYRIVPFDQPADLYVINTCTVTHVSDRKSRALIRRATRLNPGASVVVTGCMAQITPEQARSIPGVTMVVGNQDKVNLAALVESFRNGSDLMDGSHGFGSLGAKLYSHQHDRTRGFVKIQDGCQSFCTYCIVPYARGPVKSKTPADVIDEVGQMVHLGYREVVLTGIHTGMYGVDFNDTDLVGLIKNILIEVKGDYRLRLSSIEPTEVTSSLVDLFLNDNRLCRHFHIPLQSGSDRILTAMNRRYHAEEYQRLLQDISAGIPLVGLTTDVMVGFPGESDGDFQATYHLLESLPLSDLHVFKYSRREGTPAAAMNPQVSEIVKQQRSQALLELAGRKHREFIAGNDGQIHRVLVEKTLAAGACSGLTDNYIEVAWQTGSNQVGDFAQVKLHGEDEGQAWGILIQ